MKKFIPLAVIAALFTLGSFAQPSHEGKHGDHLAKALDLTAEQRASVTTIMESHRERKSELRGLDREQRRAEMQLMKQSVRADLAGILTPEQLAKFDEMQAERQARHANRGHKGNRGDHLAKKLDLSDDQRASVDAIMESHRERKSQLRDLDREQRHEAMQLLKQDVRSDMAGILTPEQLAKFDEMQAKRGKRHSKHRKQHKDVENGVGTETL